MEAKAMDVVMGAVRQEQHARLQSPDIETVVVDRRISLQDADVHRAPSSRSPQISQMKTKITPPTFPLPQLSPRSGQPGSPRSGQRPSLRLDDPGSGRRGSRRVSEVGSPAMKLGGSMMAGSKRLSVSFTGNMDINVVPASVPQVPLDYSGSRSPPPQGFQVPWERTQDMEDTDVGAQKASGDVYRDTYAKVSGSRDPRMAAPSSPIRSRRASPARRSTAASIVLSSVPGRAPMGRDAELPAAPSSPVPGRRPSRQRSSFAESCSPANSALGSPRSPAF